MISLYFFRTHEREDFVRRAIAAHAGKEHKILRTHSGKPYIEGNPLFLSISHSGTLCTLALSPLKTGVDTELVCHKNYNAVLSSFSEEEKKEIKCPRDFFMHWTAREAYVKYLGGKIWNDVKKISFLGGALYYCGKPVPEKIDFCFENGAVTALCALNTDFEIKTLQ